MTRQGSPGPRRSPTASAKSWAFRAAWLHAGAVFLSALSRCSEAGYIKTIACTKRLALAPVETQAGRSSAQNVGRFQCPLADFRNVQPPTLKLWLAPTVTAGAVQERITPQQRHQHVGRCSPCGARRRAVLQRQMAVVAGGLLVAGWTANHRRHVETPVQMMSPAKNVAAWRT